jgi:hypothetical protein
MTGQFPPMAGGFYYTTILVILAGWLIGSTLSNGLGDRGRVLLGNVLHDATLAPQLSLVLSSILLVGVRPVRFNFSSITIALWIVSYVCLLLALLHMYADTDWQRFASTPKLTVSDHDQLRRINFLTVSFALISGWFIVKGGRLTRALPVGIVLAIVFFAGFWILGFRF